MRDATLVELFGVLARQTGTLVRQEVRLASVELTDKARYASRPMLQLLGGAVLGVTAASLLIVALVLGLGTVIPIWAAALIVGGVLLGGSAIVTKRALTRLRAIDPVPVQTLLSIEETGSWVANQLH